MYIQNWTRNCAPFLLGTACRALAHSWVDIACWFKGEDILEFVVKLALLRRVRVVSFISGRQHDRPVCVVQVAGANVDEFANDLWNAGHHVLNVLRSPDSNKA